MQPPGDPSKNGLAVASLVMGILGMCFMFGGFIFDILGIIFGALSLKSQKQGFAKAGLILSIVAIALSILLFFLLILIAISEGGYYFSYDFPAPYI